MRNNMAKKKELNKKGESLLPVDCDHGKLLFPNLSVSFIQTFTLPYYLSFVCPKGGLISPYPDGILLGEDLWSTDSHNPIPPSDHYMLPGFDFKISFPMLYNTETGNWEEFHIKGKCSVKMVVFFGRTVSLKYHFHFNQQDCTSNRSFSVINLDTFLSFFLNTPFHSRVLPEAESSIFDFSTAEFNELPFDNSGNPLAEGLKQSLEVKADNGIKEAFDSIRRRYKGYIVKHGTKAMSALLYRSNKGKKDLSLAEISDTKYAFVELFPNFEDPMLDGRDFFSLDSKFVLSNKEVITHIKEHHKSDLSVIMSLISDDVDSFEAHCGKELLNEDESMLYVGEKVAIYASTSDRFKQDIKGGNHKWSDEVRQKYNGVSWPSLLLIIQFALAKKEVIQDASSVLLRNAVADDKRQNLTNIINRNQVVTFALAQSMIQYDAAKFRVIDFKQIDNQITEHLKVKQDRQEFEHNMKIIDDSLRNIKDGMASSREITMNIILGIVSVISAFQLFFVGTKMPFLSDFWQIESGTIGALLITIVAGIAIFLVLGFLFSAIKSLVK